VFLHTKLNYFFWFKEEYGLGAREAMAQVRGKVYALYTDDFVNENGDPWLYIGSTRNRFLKKRIDKHRVDYNQYLNGNKDWMSSFHIFEITNEPYFMVLEEGIYTSLDALRGQENVWVSHFKQRCLNIQKPYRTEEERKEQKRQWYVDNKEYRRKKDREMKRQWRQNNKTYSCSNCKTNPMTPDKYNRHCNSTEHKIKAFKAKRVMNAWRAAVHFGNDEDALQQEDE